MICFGDIYHCEVVDQLILDDFSKEGLDPVAIYCSVVAIIFFYLIVIVVLLEDVVKGVKMTSVILVDGFHCVVTWYVVQT